MVSRNGVLLKQEEINEDQITPTIFEQLSRLLPFEVFLQRIDGGGANFMVSELGKTKTKQITYPIDLAGAGFKNRRFSLNTAFCRLMKGFKNCKIDVGAVSKSAKKIAAIHDNVLHDSVREMISLTKGRQTGSKLMDVLKYRRDHVTDAVKQKHLAEYFGPERLING